ncbi:MAG: diguanylate cyclase [Desulfovibrio sp.]|uniref:sensor domain-containing diguanylate cyclase n=1 Tax=Desulfovibrio sp. TaxID=885 RepID=UPI0039E3A65A
MFFRVLRISLYSAEPLLEGTFKALQADADFRHKISFHAEVQSPPAEAQAKEDIYFLGPEHLVSLPDLKKAAKPTARIILIDSAGQEATLAESLISLLDEVWPSTNNRAVMDMRIKNLLSNALLSKKYTLLQHCLETAIDTTPDLVWFKDIRGAHLKVNDAFCSVVGKSKKDVTGRGHYYIWDIEPDEYADGEYVCLETEEEVIARAETCIFDEIVKTKMGMRQFKTRKSPIFDEDGTVIGTVGIAYDMTDITNSSAEVDIILQNLPFAAIILDANNRIVNTNQKFLDFFHFQSAEEIIGSYRSRLRDIAIKEYRMKQIGNRLEVRSWNEGKEIILESYERKILDIFKNRIGLLVIYRDVTKERNSQQELELSANTDELTGLFNRRYFYNNLPEIGRAETSLLFVDLDNFKDINDTYGHRAGDDALKLTARLLRENFAEALIARMGGDEFVLYLKKAHTAEQVVARARQLQKAMETVFTKDTPWEGLSASIGIVVIDTPGISRDEMVRRGDIAMYEAKRLGKHRVCQYSPDIEAQQAGSLDTLCAKPRSSCRRLDARRAKSRPPEFAHEKD